MRARTAVGALGWPLVGLALLGIAIRWVRTDWSPVIVLAAAWPLTVPLTLLALFVFATARHWWGVLTVVIVVALQGLAASPLLLHETVPAGTKVVVLQANLESGRGDAGALLAAIRQHDAGVLTVSELTAAGRDKLAAAHIDSLLPYSYTVAEEGAAGAGIWSKYPLTPVEQDDGGFVMRQVWAEADIPGAGPVMIVAAHTAAPEMKLHSPAWLAELDLTGRQLQALRPDVKVLVGGDFNATYDNFPFRQILTSGYADAVDQSGSGWMPTWRAGSWYSCLFGIDHVLTRGVTATAAATVPISGSDHLAVVATVVVPPA